GEALRPGHSAIMSEQDRLPSRFIVKQPRRTKNRWAAESESSPPRHDARLIVEHGHGTDRRAGALAPFQRQADELKFALAQQGFEIEQALHMRAVEFQGGPWHERVDLAFGPRPHRVDAGMHDALARRAFGRLGI